MKHTFPFICIIIFIFAATLPGQTWDGYVISGISSTYNHTDPYYDFLVYKLDLNGNKQWRKNYGQAISEHGGYIRQTNDGGYILSGYNSDFYVYKLYADGGVAWNRTYGGPSGEQGGRMEQTPDGGYILCGDSTSYTHGNYDLLVYKLDADGNEQWRRNYGGVNMETSAHIQPTSDGGYILAGSSSSYTHGGSDILVYRLAADGQKRWRKNYGGIATETSRNIRQTADGGFVLTGITSTYGEGMFDLLVYKINSDGAKQWRRNYGGDGWEMRGQIEPTSDGGYILAADGDSYTHGGYDLLVYKLDAKGQVQWRKNYGGASDEAEACIKQTPDGGYILSGGGNSFTHGAFDFLLYKLDASGHKRWRRNYGGLEVDACRTVQPTFH
jgi:hypothetical protein